MKPTTLSPQDQGTKVKMHPKKFALWAFMVSVVMLFAAFTSAYVVKKSDGVWLNFELPGMFAVTTFVILASSVSMQLAYYFAKQDDTKKLNICLWLTALTGVAFLYGQYLGWGELVAQDVFFVGNAAGSFLYVLTGVHGLHLMSALVFIVVVLVAAFRHQVHSKHLDGIEMCTTYWHFLGAIWLYLYLFLILNH